MSKTEPSHQRLSQEAMATFCTLLAKLGRYDLASKGIGCTSDTTIKWRNRSRKDPTDPRYVMVDPLGDQDPVPFHLACDEAMAIFLEANVESVLIEQATGYLDPVVYQGRLCFEPDTSADPLVDPISGTIYFPPKVDPLTGEPIPLAIRKVQTNSLHFLMEARMAAYSKKKQELDITSGGKPIFFPAKSASAEDFIKEYGSSRVKVEKPDAG